MGKPILALFSPNENSYSETFVRAHRYGLDADVRYIYGGWFPQFTEKNGPLVSQSLFGKGFRFLERKLSPAGRLTSHEKAIVRFLKAEKVSVALAEYGITGAKVYRACKAASVPLVVHFHGMDAFQESTLRKMKEAYQGMFQYASAVIGVSRQMCLQLRMLGVPEEKIAYTPCGPNAAFLEIQPDYNARTIISIGRFTPKKSHDITIKAFAIAAAKYPDLRLRIGGDGPMLEGCKELARALNIADKVEFAGPISHETVQNWFSNALAFALHSVIAPDGDREGTPVVILEASAAGLPVISTRHAGIPDIIVEGETGILVDEHDLDGFAAAMIQIAGDNSLASRLGTAGRQRILSNFTMKHHLGVIDQLIKKAAAG
jgi:glycosyltransferase involved in cell wall biosynthesis